MHGKLMEHLAANATVARRDGTFDGVRDTECLARLTAAGALKHRRCSSSSGARSPAATAGGEMRRNLRNMALGIGCCVRTTDTFEDT